MSDRVFVDTSAAVALLARTDIHHAQARRAFENLRLRQAGLFTSSYVLVESYALLGRRLGADAVAAFRNDFAPLLQIEWVGPELHEAGLDYLLERHARHLSLVDAVSFQWMRQERIDIAFAFDRHFQDEGFAPAE